MKKIEYYRKKTKKVEMWRKVKAIVKYFVLFILFIGIVVAISLEDSFIVPAVFFLFFFIYEYYQQNKKIERLSKDWKFCKELLDKERAENKRLKSKSK